MTKYGGVCKLRKSYVLSGFSAGKEYYVYNNTIDGLVRAAKERLLYVDYNKTGNFQYPLKPKPGVFKTTLHPFFNKLRRNSYFATPMTFDEFVNSYQGRKRTVYLNAVESLKSKPLSIRDSYPAFFLKYEKYYKENAVNRGISPRHPRYHVSLGRYVKPIEKKIYRSINRIFGYPVVCKGLNAEARGALIHDHWMSITDPVAVCLDAKRFDQHVSTEALKWEHSVYKLYYPHDAELAKLLSWQVKNKLFGRAPDGELKLNLDGGRMSGDMNTALGNVLDVCAMIWTYLEQKKIVARVFNDGDDFGVIISLRDLDNFSQGIDSYFTSLGFKMTIEQPVRVLEQIEFCQSHPVFDGTKYIMVRDPRLAIGKDSLSLKPLDNYKVLHMWLSAVGQGGLSLTGGIPVWQNFYRRMVVFSKGAKKLRDPTLETGLMFLMRGMTRKFSKPSLEARMSYFKAFDTTPDEQIAAESYYDNLEFHDKGDGVALISNLKL